MPNQGETTMIDAKSIPKDQVNGQAGAPQSGARMFRDEYVRQAPSSGKAENSDFTSFQTWAERALRSGQQEKKTNALVLAADKGIAFRGLRLPKAEIQNLRNEILMLHQKHGTLSIGFASAQKGEGTSTILANLVADLKKTDLRVLLVDLNYSHPNLPGFFSLPSNPGLTDLIAGQQQLREVVRVIKANRIFVLPLGKPHPKVKLDLANAVWAVNLAGKNAKYFDLILFDLPPLNEYPQAFSAARQTDGVIQIVQAEHTRAEMVRALKNKMERLGIRMFGAVLNQRRLHIPQFIYNQL
jgi:Mrp family chromosome partitioning ATPase